MKRGCIYGTYGFTYGFTYGLSSIGTLLGVLPEVCGFLFRDASAGTFEDGAPAEETGDDLAHGASECDLSTGGALDGPAFTRDAPVGYPLSRAFVRNGFIGNTLGNAPVCIALLGVTPAGNALAGNAPAGSGLTGNAPAGNAPAGNVPAGYAPAGNAPMRAPFGTPPGMLTAEYLFNDAFTKN